jgi:L-ascorbate metabolism protein UlaG (beta-lactamase superfamily)
MGNATVAIYQNGKGVIATDPWLTGTAYFGSWALERPLNERQMSALLACLIFGSRTDIPIIFTPIQ